jgi:hypothetical protein
LVGKPEGKRPLGDLGIDGKLILEWILGKEWEDVDLSSLGQGPHWALMNIVRNLRVS